MKACEDARIAVGWSEDAIDEIRAGKVQALFRDFGLAEAEERIRFLAEILLDGT